MDSTKDYLELIAGERRSVRTNNLSIISKVSADGENWDDIEVSNISSGGLLFISDTSLAKGDTVWFDLTVEPVALIKYNALHIQAQGEVLSDRFVHNNVHYYAAKFTDISPDIQTELDMLIHDILDNILEKYVSS